MEPKLIFDVINQHITRTDDFKPVRGSRNYLYAQFNFKTEDWSGKTKTAIFHGFGIKPISVLLDDAGGCLIPWQAVDCRSFIVSVFGGNLITANKIKVKLEDTGYKKGETPSQPDTDAYTKILEMLSRKGDGLSYVGNVLKLLSGGEEVAQVTISGSGGGQDGKEIELKNSGTYIQWRYAGNAEWTNLVALEDIKGNPGDPGEPGKTPVKGTDYFTAEDISAIEAGLTDYIDSQIGGVLNGSY